MTAATIEKPPIEAGAGHEANNNDSQTMPEPPDYVKQIEAAQQYFTDSVQEDAPPRFALLSSHDVTNTPPMQWTVKGIIPRRGVGQVYGASMSAKTFLSLGLASDIADGKAWYTHRVKQTPVVYICLEGEEGFRNRVRALEQWRGRPLSDNVHFILQHFAINETQDIEALAAVIPKGALVIVDTQNASAPFIDENTARDMGGIIAGAKDLAHRIKGFVLLVAHTGKETGRGARGSSVQLPAWDTCLEVAKSGDRREWITRKVKDGMDGKKYPFKLDIVDLGLDEDGDPITSCVAVPDTSPVQEDKPLTHSQIYALETLTQCLAKEGKDVVHIEAWRQHFYAGSTQDNPKTKNQAFNRGRKELVALKKAFVCNDFYSIAPQATTATQRDIVATCSQAKTNIDRYTTLHPSLEGVACSVMDGMPEYE